MQALDGVGQGRFDEEKMYLCRNNKLRDALDETPGNCRRRLSESQRV